MDNGLQIFKVEIDHSISGKKFSYTNDGSYEEFVTDSKSTSKW